ncbi:hypothetical protein BB560_006828 [Smittium megazygosporum]|uniref:Vacuolar transporter chaperone complex subunit 4 n=1 Tax=Smittium megazygosporum TaxID=133381 RepID=A0A2T9Y0Z9_9FUNG|nr:hypothetical protein BB560_006828 [Smittium megazygosporum]
MKFGQKLRENIFPDWKFYYLDYDGLKSLIYEHAAQGYTADHEADFVTHLEEEIEKMQEFQQTKIKEVKRSIENCHSQIDIINKNRASEAAKQEQLNIIEDEINLITLEVNELSKFTRLNFTALVKIVKKHDKNVPFMLKPIFTQRINNMPFFSESFDVLLLKLSKLYKIVRDGGQDLSLGKDPQSGNGISFVRQTTKYWVHPDNVIELKLYILKHLPVLIYKSKDDSPPNPAITSIYFDNSNLDLYSGRIEKTEGAEAIRLRWYGDPSVQDIFVERKTHHEDWTGEKSVKERFPINESLVNDYLAGSYTLDDHVSKLKAECKKSDDDLNNMLSLSREINRSVIDKKLVPVMRTFYNRTAFQLPGDASVRISLDTELTMIREDNFDGIERAGLNWRRTDIKGDYPFPQLPERDICRFPYAILEVKLQTQRGVEPPTWITNLIHSHLVEAVPKFSKFIHGVSTLLESKVNILPFWFSQMDKDIRKPPTTRDQIPLIGSRHNSYHDLASMVDLSSSRMLKASESTLQLTGSHPYDPSPPNSTVYNSIDIPDSTATSASGSASGSGNHSPPPQRAWYNLYGLFQRRSFDRNGFLRRHSTSQINPLSKNRSLSSTTQLYDNAVAGFPSSSKKAHIYDDPNKIIKVPRRVEPKVFFANERTFLAWLNFAMLLGSLSLALMNFGDQDGKLAGAIFTVVSILTMLYALSLFHWRADRISYESAGPYDDKVGPTFLVIALFIAVSLNFYFKFRA